MILIIYFSSFGLYLSIIRGSPESEKSVWKSSLMWQFSRAEHSNTFWQFVISWIFSATSKLRHSSCNYGDVNVSILRHSSCCLCFTNRDYILGEIPLKPIAIVCGQVSAEIMTLILSILINDHIEVHFYRVLIINVFIYECSYGTTDVCHVQSCTCVLFADHTCSQPAWIINCICLIFPAKSSLKRWN